MYLPGGLHITCASSSPKAHSQIISNNSMNTARPTLLEMPNVEITRNDIQGTRAGHVSG